MSGKRIKPGPGQESVWDYPRPPACEPTSDHVKIFLGDEVLADTKKAYRVLETSHPPVYYIPQADINMQKLQKTGGSSSYCEWKGSATYFNARSGVKSIAWTYESPTQRFAPIKNYLAFYPSKVQKAFVNDEEVKAQEGDFYGGWITEKITGPFKGGMGTWGW